MIRLQYFVWAEVLSTKDIRFLFTDRYAKTKK